MVFETLATFSYNIVYIYTSELFPTYTRNSMHAICSAMGRVGSLIAPQTPLLVITNQHHYIIELLEYLTQYKIISFQLSYWSGLPALLFGLTSLLCGVLTLFIPETANCELPDTVQEAELIGKKKKQIKEMILLTSETKSLGTGDPLLNEHCKNTILTESGNLN